MVKNNDYKREITHTSYRHGDKEIKPNRFSRILPMRITENVKKYKKKVSPNGIPYVDNDYIQKIVAQYSGPIIYRGVFFILFIMVFLINLSPSEGTESKNLFVQLSTLFFFLGSVFHGVYAFTMPKRELILDRENGLFTFPVFFFCSRTLPCQ